MHSIKRNDYGYASSGSRGGEQTLDDYNNGACTSTNWLYDYYTGFQWMLFSDIEIKYYVSAIAREGDVGGYCARNNYSVRPTIYISSNIKITSGNGTIENPYNLRL